MENITAKESNTMKTEINTKANFLKIKKADLENSFGIKSLGEEIFTKAIGKITNEMDLELTIKIKNSLVTKAITKTTSLAAKELIIMKTENMKENLLMIFEMVLGYIIGITMKNMKVIGKMD